MNICEKHGPSPRWEGRRPRRADRGSFAAFRLLSLDWAGNLSAVQFLHSVLWITARRPRLTRLCDFCPGLMLLLITLWILDRPVGVADHVRELPKLADPSHMFCMSKINIHETYNRPVAIKSRSLDRGSRIADRGRLLRENRTTGQGSRLTVRLRRGTGRGSGLD